MTFSPLLCLHVESGILLVFLGRLLLSQWGRITDPALRLQNGRRQFRWMAFLFVLSSLVFVPLMASLSPLLGAELAVGFTLALMHPVNALCLFIHMLFLRPWEVMPGNPLLAALPRLLAGICVLSWILHPETHKRLTGTTARTFLILLCFSLWVFLTTFIAADPAAAQAHWFDTYFKVLVVFGMCLLFIGDTRGVEALKGTILVSVLGMVSLALFEFLYFPSTAGAASQRLHSRFTVLDPNDLAAVTVLALPLALAPFLGGAGSDGGAGRRFLGLLSAGLSLVAIWYSQSRGALIALFAEIMGAFTFLQLRRRWFGALLLSGFLAAGYFGVLKASTRSQEDLGVSAESRAIYWKAAVRMALRNPLLGVGYDQYPSHYESYSAGNVSEWGERTAHSSWLLAFAESGLVGGALFLAFFLAVARTAWRRRLERPGHLYALAGYGVAMSFLSHTYQLYPYLLCGLILSSDAVQETTLAA